MNVATVFLGFAPERPKWLRRTVQAMWMLSAIIVAIAWVYGLTLVLDAL